MSSAGRGTLRIATRGSALALTQSNHMAAQIRALGFQVELVVRKTIGDVVVDRPFKAMEGKGFFTKELEEALLADEADLAVHSLKDLPTELPTGLALATVPEREDAADWLLIRRDALDRTRPLPVKRGARVGTSSTRRRSQWAARRPDTVLLDLRGNVPTRVEKLRSGAYDAILLASAGLRRLQADLTDFFVFPLDPAIFVCAPAQGALGIEVREADGRTREALSPLDDGAVRAAVAAERAVLAGLGGGCSQPVGAYARKRGAGVLLDAVLGPVVEGSAPLRRARVEGSHFEEAARIAVEWLRSPNSEIPRSLAGRKVCITQQADRGERLARELEERGAEVRLAPMITTVSICDSATSQRLESAAEYDVVVFTSATAAQRFFEAAPAKARAALASMGTPIAAVGEATAEVLERAGLPATIVGTGGGAALAGAVVQALGAHAAGSRVLHPCALEPRPELAAALEAVGARVEAAPLYQTEGAAAQSLEALAGERFDAALFASPSAVKRFAELRPFELGAAVAIGATTLAALREHALGPARAASSPDPADVARALEL